MNKKINKIHSIVFVIIVFGFNLGLFYNIIYAYLMPNQKNLKQTNLLLENITNHDEKTDSNKTKDKANNSNSFSHRIEKIKNRIEKHIKEKGSIFAILKVTITQIDRLVNNHIPLRIKLVEFGHFINKLTGGNMFLKLDNLIRFDNGYFAYIEPNKDSFEKDGLNIVEFANYLNSLNIKFCYILCPSKLSKFKNDLPQGMIDYSNSNADSLLNVLYKNHLPVLDLREIINRNFNNHFDAFFKTDHHWLPETGFLAANEILRFLNNNLGFKFDTNILKKENFTFLKYPKQFLGSCGRKVTLSLAEPEDFSLITPKFETNFTFSPYNDDRKLCGKFDDSLIIKNNLEKDYYNIDTYSSYIGIGGKVSSICNEYLKSNNYKLLFIVDSYSCVVLPFIACATKNILWTGVRREKTDTLSIKALIEKEKPNAVLILYNVGQFNPLLENRGCLSIFE